VVRSRAKAVGELRLADLSTFVTVHRTESVTAAARELGVTPSQVSKAITRLEKIAGGALFTRGARGLTLSSLGQQMLPQFEQVVQALEALDRTDRPPEGELTLGAPSSILLPILPRVARALPRMRVRGVEFPPGLLRRYAADGVFDVAVLAGGTNGFPPRWASVHVGELRKSLFASPAVARRIGPRPTAAQVKRESFVGPLAYDGGKLVSSPDDCPLGLGERLVAVEVGTMDLALRVAAQSEHLVFGPVIAAHREIVEGSIVELRVPGWDVSEPIHIVCNAERVLARTQTAIADVVRATLAEAEARATVSES
jgi:DNA-binding transcriptional LysR family regulator